MGFAQTSVCNKANKKTKGILGHLTDMYTYIYTIRKRQQNNATVFKPRWNTAARLYKSIGKLR